jgi:predicted outer membrane repeat protein
VITIRGAINVTLSHLTITGGNDVIGGNDDEGGGVDYAGVGALVIDNTTIFDNIAEYGGGIRVQGSGGAANLYVDENTFITNNTANTSGGGIRVEDNASAYIDSDQIWIAMNEATNGYGGGIAAVGKTYLHIGSPGYSIAEYIGVIYQNTAQYGGGIALIANAPDANAGADILATDPNHPVRIEQNRAYHTGGGIYLEPWTGNGGLASAYMQLGGAQVDSNAAPEGSGIYADTDSFADLPVGSSARFLPGYCAAGLECNTASNNRAVDGSDNPTAGSAILIQTDGRFEAAQFVMRGNEGAHAIRVADSLESTLLLDTCLLAGNSVTAELVTFGSAAATLDQCTFAYNAIGGPAVIRAETGFAMTNSIVAQGTLPTIAYTGTGNGETLDYILSLETATLGAGQHIIQGDPSFVDPGNGDFHLYATSLAVDVAPAGSADDRDLDGLPRDVDLTSVPNLDGPRDLGAYELQVAFQSCGVSDTLFCNGFEAGP